MTRSHCRTCGAFALRRRESLSSSSSWTSSSGFSCSSKSESATSSSSACRYIKHTQTVITIHYQLFTTTSFHTRATAADRYVRANKCTVFRRVVVVLLVLAPRVLAPERLVRLSFFADELSDARAARAALGEQLARRLCCRHCCCGHPLRKCARRQKRTKWST